MAKKKNPDAGPYPGLALGVGSVYAYSRLRKPIKRLLVRLSKAV